MTTIEKIYIKLQQCDKVKSDMEIKDILNDLSIINNVLDNGYVKILENNMLVDKNIEQIYQILYSKYVNKLEQIGLKTYHNLRLKYGNSNVSYYINNNNSANKLIALKSWIVEYGAYKVLEHEFKKKVEECMLESYKDSIKSLEELERVMEKLI